MYTNIQLNIGISSKVLFAIEDLNMNRNKLRAHFFCSCGNNRVQRALNIKCDVVMF